MFFTIYFYRELQLISQQKRSFSASSPLLQPKFEWIWCARRSRNWTLLKIFSLSRITPKPVTLDQASGEQEDLWPCQDFPRASPPPEAEHASPVRGGIHKSPIDVKPVRIELFWVWELLRIIVWWVGEMKCLCAFGDASDPLQRRVSWGHVRNTHLEAWNIKGMNDDQDKLV